MDEGRLAGQERAGELTSAPSSQTTMSYALNRTRGRQLTGSMTVGEAVRYRLRSSGQEGKRTDLDDLPHERREGEGQLGLPFHLHSTSSTLISHGP